MNTIRRRPLHFRPRPRGFSLVEMLVVMTIIVSLASLAIPLVSGSSNARAVDLSARRLKTTLEQARFLSAAERVRVRVLLRDDRRSFTLAVFDRDKSHFRLRGRWNFVETGVALDFDASKCSESPVATSVDLNTGSGSEFVNWPYIEFLPNGAATPAAKSPPLSPASLLVRLRDAVISTDSPPKITPKNIKLFQDVTVDPLAGTVSLAEP